MLTRLGSQESRKRRREARTESDDKFFEEILAKCSTSSTSSPVDRASSKKPRLGRCNDDDSFLEALLSESAPGLPSPPSSTDKKGQKSSSDDRNGVAKATSHAPQTEETCPVEDPTGEERDPAKIRAKLAKLPSFGDCWSERKYTADLSPLISGLRTTMRSRCMGCGLCEWYEWGPIAGTHELKHCTHREEAREARRWLEMFRGYQAQGGGKGARCQHCRFPVALCWRTVYREEMDAKYGNEVEAREQFGQWYREVRCDWVKAVQRFVASRMVAGGIVGGRGVSEVGFTALHEMGWKDWSGLEEHGPSHMQRWLEETDDIRGLRCPRLLKLFWKLDEAE